MKSYDPFARYTPPSYMRRSSTIDPFLFRTGVNPQPSPLALPPRVQDAGVGDEIAFRVEGTVTAVNDNDGVLTIRDKNTGATRYVYKETLFKRGWIVKKAVVKPPALKTGDVVKLADADRLKELRHDSIIESSYGSTLFRSFDRWSIPTNGRKLDHEGLLRFCNMSTSFTVVRAGK